MKCFICGLEYGAANVDHQQRGEKKLVECPRCGSYEVTGTLIAMMEAIDAEPDYQLSAYLRDLSTGRSTPVLLNSQNLESFRQNLPHYNVSEKMRHCLKYLALKSTYPGEVLQFHGETEFVTAWANSIEEYAYIVRSLIDRGLVDGKTDGNSFIVHLTAEGWGAVEAGPENRTDSAQVFVAMSFSPELADVYHNGIRQAVEAAGYSPYRVDQDLHNERIDAKIANEIRDSRFLIADVTEQKAGVYYEAGFAQGLGLEVIWCVRKDDLHNVHFDTRQYAHIVWEDIDDLQESLKNLIEAVVGRGPLLA